MDLSGLSLLADVAEGFDSNTSASSKSKSLLAIQILMEMRVLNKKGLLLSDLGKGLRVPKRKRSNLSDRRRTDLLAFCVPKRKRSGDPDDQIQTPKRQKTTPAHDFGSSLQLGMSCSSQDIKSKIDIPLWSFQRKSQFRFSLIKTHQSVARTTMVG